MTEPGIEVVALAPTTPAASTDASPADPAPADPPAVALPIAPAVGADASLLALVDRLATILERSDLLELEVEAGGTGLRLRKPEAISPAAMPPPAGAAAAATPPSATAGSRDVAEAAGRPSVKAPLTGIWYSAPAPGTAPFVEVGREVAVGQVIGLIEAMKLFNEIKSDLAGRVVKVMTENGQLVKARQPLIEVEPL